MWYLPFKVLWRRKHPVTFLTLIKYVPIINICQIKRDLIYKIYKTTNIEVFETNKTINTVLL